MMNEFITEFLRSINLRIVDLEIEISEARLQCDIDAIAVKLVPLVEIRNCFIESAIAVGAYKLDEHGMSLQ